MDIYIPFYFNACLMCLFLFIYLCLYQNMHSLKIANASVCSWFNSLWYGFFFEELSSCALIGFE